jgi:hypothetical protein
MYTHMTQEAFEPFAVPEATRRRLRELIESLRQDLNAFHQALADAHRTAGVTFGFDPDVPPTRFTLRKPSQTELQDGAHMVTCMQNGGCECYEEPPGICRACQPGDPH